MRSALARLVLCAVLFVALGGTARGDDGTSEVLRYQWRLQGFSGFVAGLFLPHRGQGALVTHDEGGRLQSELLITARDGGGGEFWRYGAEFDPHAGVTLRAWSSYLFRGERKSKETVVTEKGVIDVASAIYLLRQHPPQETLGMRIWSDGKVYPVKVVPGGQERRQIGAKSVLARRYTIAGVNLPGERQWKGRLELWLADDAAATPVEITVERSWAGVKLQLVP